MRLSPFLVATRTCLVAWLPWDVSTDLPSWFTEVPFVLAAPRSSLRSACSIKPKWLLYFLTYLFVWSLYSWILCLHSNPMARAYTTESLNRNVRKSFAMLAPDLELAVVCTPPTPWPQPSKHWAWLCHTPRGNLAIIIIWQQSTFFTTPYLLNKIHISIKTHFLNIKIWMFCIFWQHTSWRSFEESGVQVGGRCGVESS